LNLQDEIIRETMINAGWSEVVNATQCASILQDCRRSRKRITRASARIKAQDVGASAPEVNELVNSTLINGLFIFMLACFIGFEVIRRVSPLLHTPLMSLTNALDAIAVVGAIALVGQDRSRLSVILGTIAIVAATSNVVGGFFITDRMLKISACC
jgi:NAD(P) transhydrogenase subunit alpha